MGEIRNLHDAINKRKESYFKIKNEDIHFLELFSRALNICTIKTHSSAKNEDYNPIFFYDGETYDPYMMAHWDVEFFCNVADDGKGLLWPGVDGIERTRIFIEYAQSFIKPYTMNIKNVFNKNKDPMNRFWFTKETLTENSMIISILHVPTKSIKRIIITDLKAVCIELSCGRHDFTKILGEDHKEYHPIVLYNPAKPLTQKEVTKRFDEKLNKILPYLRDGSYIAIQDQNVYEILDALGFLSYSVSILKISDCSA